MLFKGGHRASLKQTRSQRGRGGTTWASGPLACEAEREGGIAPSGLGAFPGAEKAWPENRGLAHAR